MLDEEKVIRRGEVWWIEAGVTVGAEIAMGRPAVILSGDAANEKCATVLVAYTTTQQKRGAIFPSVRFGGKSCAVMCNKIAAVDKQRLDRKIATLTESEMIRVGGALAVAMCIPQCQPKPQPDETAATVEAALYKKLYEKALSELADLKFARDLAAVAVVEEPPVVEEKPPVVEKPKKTDEKPIDINLCAAEELRELGLSDEDARSIIGCRPFANVLELNCVPDLDTKWVATNEHRFVCTKVLNITGKVNLNTCSGKDLIALGISSAVAYRITGHRKRNGPFVMLSDLLNVKSIGQKWLDRWADKLEV